MCTVPERPVRADDEAVIRRAWASGEPPSVLDYLPPADATRLREALAQIILAAARVQVEREAAERAAAEGER